MHYYSSTLSSPLFHPVSLVLFEIFATALAIGYTSHSSLIRPALLPLVAVSTCCVIVTCLEDIPRIFWASLVAGNAPTYLLRYLDLVLLDRWSFEAGGPAVLALDNDGRKEGRVTTGSRSNGCTRSVNAIMARLRFGLLTTLSSRQVNTPFQVKNVPRFSNRHADFVPSRAVFLRDTALAVLVCYLVVDLSTMAAQPEQNPILFNRQNVPLLARWYEISAAELVVRTFTSLAVWLNIYCIFRVGHGIMGFVAVSTGLSEVTAWPPAFGPLAEAYTVRRFWGIFWHQMFRQPFSGAAAYLVHDIFHLPKSGVVQRYSKIFAIFFISGLLHLLTDIGRGISFDESGSLRFFCTQALGIVVEDGVQTLFRPARDGFSGSWRSSSAHWTRIVGFLWLTGFAVWSTPVWAYPAIRRDIGEEKDIILPFSVVKSILG